MFAKLMPSTPTNVKYDEKYGPKQAAAAGAGDAHPRAHQDRQP